MAVAKASKMSIRRLKRQVSKARRNELAARKQLKSALSKVKKLVRTHQVKLNRKTREAKLKVAAAEAAVYAKLAKTLKQRGRVRKVKKAVKSAAAPKAKRGRGRRRK